MITDRPDDEAALTYAGLRQLIGVVALSLPAVLLTYGILRDDLRPSISEYVLTPMRDYLTGTLCVIGVFLLAYRFGTVHAEGWIAKAAGTSALVVAFVHVDGRPGLSPGEVVHGLAAATLLALLGVISFVYFPGSGIDEPRRLYRTLGVVIWASLAVLGLLLVTARAQLDRVLGIFWLETVAVVAFAVAFLVKGRFLVRPVQRMAAALRARRHQSR